MTTKDDPYVDVTRNPSLLPPKEGEVGHAHASAHADDMHAPGNDTPPPEYTPDEQVYAGFRSLARGDPNEKISVPMIHSIEKKNLKEMIMRERGKVSQTVIVRKMPRWHYLAHYAKDEDGNYVGTDKPAADAGLVFVPSQSTPEDIKEQVRKVAFGKLHYGGSSAGMGMGMAMGGASGGF